MSTCETNNYQNIKLWQCFPLQELIENTNMSEIKLSYNCTRALQKGEDCQGG